MTQPCSRQERDQSSFVESPKRAGQSARGVVIENDTPIEVIVDPAANPKIYNLTMVATVQNNQLLTDGTKKILIKPRVAANIELSYDSGFAEFITIPKGNAYEIQGISSSSLTLYFKADKNTVLEIEEWT